MSARDSEEKKNEDGGSACGCCDTCAFTLNDYIEKAFGAVGWYIGAWPYLVLGLVLLFLALCCVGFLFLTTETDIFNLWTPTDSPVFDEKEFIDFYWGDKDYGLIIISGYAKAGEDTDILSDEYMQQWYQIHLDLATKLPTKDYPYIALDNSEQSVTFGYFAENYNDPLSLPVLGAYAEAGLGPTSYGSEVIPLCRPIAQSPAEAQFIMPCYMLSVIDCFSEGGYFFPWENYLENTQLSSSIPANPFTYARDSFVGLSNIAIGERLGSSCSGWTGVTAPPNLIYGGETRLNESDAQSTIIKVKSYQIASFTDSAAGIAKKVKIQSGQCGYTATYGLACPEITDEEKEEAQQFLDDWLLDYIDFMADYTKSLQEDDSKLFNLVYYTPRTTRDLLREASGADFALLAIAYIAMIVFASLTAINVNDWFLSRSEASFAGVLLVLLAVLSTIGLGSFLQIPLSPNIVQVLPFIALGFGVDDMFVLLFSFKFRERVSVQEMIAETTRIAGSSVALTSLANFVGFLIGSTMVLPDIARFATFGAIIVLLNFVAIIFGFTGVLTLVARRMKNEYNDWSFVFCWATFTRAAKVTSEKPSSMDTSIFDPLFDWLTKTYTRVVMVVAFIVLVVIGGYGCTLISPGLPLADIVPTDNYASEFLRIREKFYFSYPVSLYTDANGADLTPIDWENKFEDWLDATNDIYSISPTVFPDAEVHSFWAWSLQSYLATQWTSELSQTYPLGTVFDYEAALADDPVYQSWMCREDAIRYCPSIDRDYSYGSQLFNCLLVNYQFGNLQSDCAAWIEPIYIENVITPQTAIAKQIYITSFDDPSVDGLYVRPSTNDIKVFIRQPNNDGYIYQTDCGMSACEWRLLDSQFNTLYIGDPTSTDSDNEAPAQGGWRDGQTGTMLVAITHIYYDFFVSYLGQMRDASLFMQTDHTPQNMYSFTHSYTPSNADTDTVNACNQWEVVKLLMSDADAFNEISMVSDFGDSDTLCNAILESSELCNSIRDQTVLGSKYCGSSETYGAAHNLWYAGLTSDGDYQILSSPNGTSTDDVSTETFNNCADPSAWETNTDFTYNYLKACGSIDDFGGFGVSQTNDQVCNAEDQTINVQCQEFTDCTDLRVCYNDFEVLFEADPTSDCTGDLVRRFDLAYHKGKSAYALSQVVRSCAFKSYSKLSSCCQSAVNTEILTLPQMPCSQIEIKFASVDMTIYAGELELVCQATEQCVYNSAAEYRCSEYQVTDKEVFDECYRLIVGEDAPCSLANLGVSREMNQTAFYDCMSTEVAKTLGQYGMLPKSGSDTCEDTFNASAPTYQNCLYPIDSFYDFEANTYDYSICSDAEIASIASIANTTECGLNCLAANVDSLDPGCCQRAIQQISDNSYTFTRECQGDIVYFCSDYGITSAADALLYASMEVPNALSCLRDIGIKAADFALSTKCLLSLGTCEANGDWGATAAGGNASLPCGVVGDVGYAGEQTRVCQVAAVGVEWSDIDRSQCVPLTCPEIFADDNDNITASYDQYWPQTTVGSVYKVQGGFINTVMSLVGEPDVDTTTQVGSTLQQMYMAEADGVSCNPNVDHNVWYARRACMLDPYDSSQAVWQEPLVECKPFVTLWNNVQENTVCDFVTEQVTAGVSEVLSAAYVGSTKKANLIDAIVWLIYDATVGGGVTTTAAQQISLSQTYCSLLLDKCAAYSYDHTFGISYFFDYCPTISSSDMAGFIPELVDSPANQLGIFDTAAAQASMGTLTKEQIILPWAAYDDPIFAQFAPNTPAKLHNFADRHSTYIAPLSAGEFVASYCSLGTIGEDVTAFIPPTQAWNANGIPNPECFNNTLWLFFIDPTGPGVVKRDSVVFKDETQVGNLTGFDNVQIVTTSNTIIVKDINDDEVAVEFITHFRERLDLWAEDGLYAVPGGLIIDLFSQYIGVTESLINNLIYVSIAIFCCGLVFLLNPIAVFVAVLCNAAMVIEVYGFSDWFGLRINGVLVLNITIAVALTMEFTAHIGRAFVLTFVTEQDRKSSIALPFSNDGQIRMKKTLREMFTPVSLGALTTLIGVSPIAAAQFPYFRQYYFTLYVMIVLFGWLNGVIFQVTILSFFPPKPFVHFKTTNIASEKQAQTADSPTKPLVQQTQGQTGDKQEIIQQKHTRNDKDAP